MSTKTELNFQDHIEKLSTYIKQFTGVEKGELRPFVSQFRPKLDEKGEVVLNKDGSKSLTPITVTKKDKDGNEQKQYITTISFYKKDEKDPLKATNVVVNVYSKYLIDPNSITVIKDKLVKEGLDRFKDTPIKKLTVEEYKGKDGKVTKTLTFSTSYSQFEIDKKKETKTKEPKESKEKVSGDLAL